MKIKNNGVLLAYHKDDKRFCLIKEYKKVTLALSIDEVLSDRRNYSLITYYNAKNYDMLDDYKEKFNILGSIDILFSSLIKKNLTVIKQDLYSDILMLLRNCKKLYFFKSIVSFISQFDNLEEK